MFYRTFSVVSDVLSVTQTELENLKSATGKSLHFSVSIRTQLRKSKLTDMQRQKNRPHACHNIEEENSNE
jgi:hypothetical protein